MLFFSKFKTVESAISRCLNCFIVTFFIALIQQKIDCLALVKNFRMCTVSSVFRTASLRTDNYKVCWWIWSICIYICMLFRKDVVTLKMTGKGKGRILTRSLFTGLICSNKCNVLIMLHCNSCCGEKAINIIYSVCVFVALGTQHSMRMRRIMFISVGSLAVRYFSSLSDRRYDFGKSAWTWSMFDFLPKFCHKHFSSDVININTSSSKVPIILILIF